MEGKAVPEETPRSGVYAKAQQLPWKSLHCYSLRNRSTLFGNGRLLHSSRLTSARFEAALRQKCQHGVFMSEYISVSLPNVGGA